METFIPQRFGKFFLINMLGKGGMAMVYLATDIEKFDRNNPEKSFIALKQLFPRYSAQQGFIKCLVDEAKLTSMLKHPNIVEVLDLGNVKTDFYLTMNWVDGRSLHNLFQAVRERNKVISKNFLFYIFQRVARGLNYAHELRDSANRRLDMVHCDISPQNILISYAGEVKLSDFGIATAEKSQEQANSEILLGKLPYLAPEQITMKGFDRRVDIYSFGVLMYEGLTGRRPLDAMTVKELQDKIIREIPSYSSKVFSSFPRVREFIEACLSKNPDHRPSSISEFFKLDDEVGDADEIKISQLMKLLFKDQIKREKDNIQLAVNIMMATDPQNDPLKIYSEENSFTSEKSEVSYNDPRTGGRINEITKAMPVDGTFEMTKVAFKEVEKESVGRVQVKRQEIIRIIKKTPVEEIEWDKSEPTQRKTKRELKEMAKSTQDIDSLDDVFDDPSDAGSVASEKTIVDFQSKWTKADLGPSDEEIESEHSEIDTDSWVQKTKAKTKITEKKIGIEDREPDLRDNFEAEYPTTGEVKKFIKVSSEQPPGEAKIFTKIVLDPPTITADELTPALPKENDATREAKIQLKVVRKPLSEVKMNFQQYPDREQSAKKEQEKSDDQFFQEISHSEEDVERVTPDSSFLRNEETVNEPVTFHVKKWTMLIIVGATLVLGMLVSQIPNPFGASKKQTISAAQAIRTVDLYISIQDLENAKEKTAISLWMEPSFQQSFISPIQSFFTREYESYTNSRQLPFRFVFSGLERGSPKIPWQGGLFNSYLPFDKFYKIFQLDTKKDSDNHGRIFVHLYTKTATTPTDYPIDYQGGRPSRNGVLYYPLFSESDTEFQLRLAHEILHMFGAKDLYNDKGLPKYPEGYGEPFKEPLHPQKFGEIMSRSIAQNPSEYVPLSSLDDSKIGPFTAYELGWITESQKDDFYKR